MGKQVNFYMLPEDESIFLKFLESLEFVVLLKPVFESREPEIIVFNSIMQSTAPFLLIWNKTTKIKEYIVPDRPRIGTNAHGIYEIDRRLAPVIEYSRSFLIKDKGLTRGRIWAEVYPWTLPGEDDPDGRVFVSTYNIIARWLRRNLTRVKEIDEYMGQNAIKWYQGGGKLLG